MAKTTLTISSKNYSSWSLRGWLLTKFSGLEFEEVVTAPDDASARAEILLLSSSILVPCLRHEGATIWDTLAIAAISPRSSRKPGCCRRTAFIAPIAGRFAGKSTRASRPGARPVNLKGDFPSFKICSRAQADIDRVLTIWRECLGEFGGPCLFGERTIADAMFAPVVTRFRTYDVKIDQAGGLCDHHGHARDARMDRGRQAEPAEIEELEVEY